MPLLAESEKKPRETCTACRRPRGHCYCARIHKVHTPFKFVILIHHIEVRRKIATGRMAHLCLADSVLIPGSDYTADPQVNAILSDPHNHCVLLYPGKGALNLSENADAAPLAFPAGKKPVIFVIDGTWNTARKTLLLSSNLRKLPTICFTPLIPSRFRVRKQPAAQCYATIEAIHHVLTLFPDDTDRTGGHSCDVLLDVFESMVEQQLKYIPQPNPSTR